MSEVDLDAIADRAERLRALAVRGAMLTPAKNVKLLAGDIKALVAEVKRLRLAPAAEEVGAE